MDEMIAGFDIKRVHSAGAKFDYEKAKWFNHEWIKKLDVESLKLKVKEVLSTEHIQVSDDAFLEKVIELVKDRCTLMPDFIQHAGFFFKAPASLDVDAVKPKWNGDKKLFFEKFITKLQAIDNWELSVIETEFKNLATEKNIKPGELQLPMRIMLVGGKFGPAVFQIAELIGKEETTSRIKKALGEF